MSAWFPSPRGLGPGVDGVGFRDFDSALGVSVSVGFAHLCLGTAGRPKLRGLRFGIRQRLLLVRLGLGLEGNGVLRRFSESALAEGFGFRLSLDLVALGFGNGPCLVGLRIGRPSHVRLQALCRELCLQLGEMGLLRDDFLRRLGLGQWSGLGGASLGLLSLGRESRLFDLGVAQVLVRKCRRLLLALRGLLVGFGGGDARQARYGRCVRGSDVVDVSARVLDLLDLQRVDTIPSFSISPWLPSFASWAKRSLSRMISSTVKLPMMDRKCPAKIRPTSSSIRSCSARKRRAAFAIEIGSSLTLKAAVART